MSVNRAAVVGAGTMGHGIAQVLAQAGVSVKLMDTDAAQLERAQSNIEASLKKLVQKDKIKAEAAEKALSRITTHTSIEDAVSDAEWVIEAAPERMELKLQIFADIDKYAPTTCLLGTNTSSLSVTEIAAATTGKENVIGLHFFNPVPLMKLLEIVSGLDTAAATQEAARRLSTQIGKEAVFVNDWPGFATSRLGIILGCEAIRMVEQGVAKPADIDRAMELGYRHPMGPLKLTDLVGLDVRLAIMEHLHRELGEQFRPPVLLRQMVRAGKLGKKSGCGFYDYD